MEYYDVKEKVFILYHDYRRYVKKHFKNKKFFKMMPKIMDSNSII